ncbi:MAG: methyltransferase domain-containing protein [Rhodospirillaceae bacterium]|nr:methyltransferase domain-containing protein [Rhodospirillaceae bacterium]
MSSGNPIADRRFEFARRFAARGDHAAAADLVRQALELAPRWAEGHFSLGDALALAGERDGAVAAFRAYLALEPADSMGARARLAQLGEVSATEELPRAYVERLFDQYAVRFDQSLLEGLKYTGPRQIRDTLMARWPGRRFARCLDLGCGTGLMGAAIRDSVDRLEGADISAGMLAEAKKKNIYDALGQTDVLTALESVAATYDLILAADVLVYIGDLLLVIAACARALAPGGVVAFTLQSGESPNYRLGADQRFSHHVTYIESLMKGAFAAHTITAGAFRREKDVDVPGLLVIGEKI